MNSSELLTHLANGPWLANVEAERDDARELAASYLYGRVVLAIENGSTEEAEANWLKCEFKENPWLEAEFKKWADTEVEMRKFAKEVFK